MTLYFHYEVVYATIGNPAFCRAIYLTGVHFRGELQHVGHLGEQKIKCRPTELEKKLVSDCKTNYML